MRFFFLLAVIQIVSISRASAQLPAVQSAVAQVSLDSLTHFVRQLTGEVPVVISGVQDTIKSRLYTHPDNEKAFQFLKEKMQGYGLSVDSVVVGQRKNLIATLPGTTAHAYIIGAHYDCVGLVGLPFAGADDNASGSAAVIEAARILSAMPKMPATIRFAFWDEEELGMLGSRDFTMTALNPALHRGYINLDMIGYDGNGDSLVELYTSPAGSSRTLADLAQAMPALYNIGLQIERMDPGPSNTDYAPFWDLNYTAIGLAEDLNGDRNPFYHQSSDSLSKFNLPYFRKLSQLAIALLAHSAVTDAASIAPGGQPLAGFKAWWPLENSGTTLYFQTPGNGEISFGIFDAGGRLVHQKTIAAQSGVQTVRLENAPLPAGLYFCVAKFSGAGGAADMQRLRLAILPR